jgi:ribosome-binding ATPase
MQIALIGWQSSGKSSLFKAVTGSEPSIGEEAHMGIANVPDAVLDQLHELYPPAKKIRARVDYLDVVGLSTGQKKSGFKRSLVNHMQGATVLAAVIGEFQHGEMDAASLAEDALSQVAELETEMLLSDLATAEPRLEKIEKQKKRGQKVDEVEKQALLRTVDMLNEEKPLRELEYTVDEEKAIRGLGFMSQKPMLIVVNHGEDQDGPAIKEAIVSAVSGKLKRAVVLNASLEAEIGALEEEDRALFMEEMEIETAASDKVIQASFDLLGLVRFFTVGDDEVRAWPVVDGTDAVNAAGTIHSDLQRGFIRAEVVHSDDLLRLGTMSKCRDEGVLRLEGKTYTVLDGDIMHIRFAI